MIVTLTPNPSLDRAITIPEQHRGGALAISKPLRELGNGDFAGQGHV